MSAPANAAASCRSGSPWRTKRTFLTTGRWTFTNQVDRGSGTIAVRAVLDNKERIFTPGLYTRVRLVGSGEFQAVLIDDKAVLTDQDRNYVYIVDKDGLAQRRDVQLGGSSHGLRIVREGLAAATASSSTARRRCSSRACLCRPRRCPCWLLRRPRPRPPPNEAPRRSAPPIGRITRRASRRASLRTPLKVLAHGILQVLHRQADLRGRAVDRHLRLGPAGDPGAADQRVSRGRASLGRSARRIRAPTPR